MNYSCVMGIILIAIGICEIAVSNKKENRQNRKLFLVLGGITAVCGLLSIVLNVI